MASGASNYTALIRATVDLTKVRADLKSLQDNTKLNFNTTSAGELNNQFKKVESTNKNITQDLSKNAAKVVEWGIATTLVYGTLQEIRNAMEYIVSLNKEMTNIRIVTGMDSEQVSNLATEYNQLAKEMGTTTLEVAKGSTEWFRQGKTVQETSELMKSSLMMSKLGNMESAQATEYLTSMLNGFKLEAKDSVGIIDKLTNLDNNYATSISEIASALQRSANSAQIAGVSFEELSAYITVVSSVTRKSSMFCQN